MSGGDAAGEALDKVPALAQVNALSLGFLTIMTPDYGPHEVRRPLLDRESAAVVEVASGQPWTSQLLARAFVQPADRERMALALAPWLCPRYQAWGVNAHEGSVRGPAPIGHGSEGACDYRTCRAVTTAAMIADGA